MNEKIVAPLRLTRTDTQELYSQLETIIEVLQDPKLLLDLSAPKLNPIREIVVELSEKFETEVKGFKRKKILEYFLNNISDTNVLKYFSVGGFIKLMSDYPKAIKIYELLVEKVFSLSNSMPIETFLNIVDKYYRIKDERNHSAHAREDHGEFKTTKKLREVMSKGIKEIQANLPPQ